MSNDDAGSAGSYTVSLRHTLWFLALITALGVGVSGAMWLLVFNWQYTPALDFYSGPAVVGLILTLIVGWLLSASIGLTLYVQGNSTKKTIQAILMVIVCGIITSMGTGYILTKYAESHYSTFCGE